MEVKDQFPAKRFTGETETMIQSCQTDDRPSVPTYLFGVGTHVVKGTYDKTRST